MPKISYTPHKFSVDSMKMIEQANKIIEDYAKQGFKLTLRQLYYQFVAKNLIANSMKNYKNMGATISKARLAGMIDWEAIEDRGRFLQGRQHWTDPKDIVHAVANTYHTDWWKGQPNKPEVWIEKDALAGVVESVCTRYDVPFFSCRGYNSQSAMWESAQRIKKRSRSQGTVILHFGDHDPSGMDMTRDMETRLEDVFGADLDFDRIALFREHVTKYKLPPNPAKEADSRFAGYVKKFGKKCWELDALDVKVLSDLIESSIKNLIKDKKAWNKQKESEEEGQETIREVCDGM